MVFYLLAHRNPNGDHFYPTRNRRLKAIIIHCTAGLEDKDLIGPDNSAENTARYAATTDRQVSWQSGSDTDTFVQLLPYSYTAFQCVGYNSSTAGHEISKLDMVWSDEKPEWVQRTIKMAALGPDGVSGLRKLALENGIPFRRATKAELDHAIATDGPPVGFVTHAELDPDRRTDPGRDFPWSMFLGFLHTTKEDDLSAEDVRNVNAHTDAKIQELYEQLERQLGATAVNNPRSWLNAGIATRVVLNIKAALKEFVDKLRPPAPPV